jgi:signal transduction histidine kinase
MTRRLITLVVLGLGLAGHALAADLGTAAEAKAMLDKTTTALQADKAGTLVKITKGEGGFKDRDLYPFCGGPDGVYTAHGANPSLVGKSLKEIKDKNGKAVGEELYAVAQEGKVAEVAYVWPRPGASSDPVQKVSFVTKVGDQVCAVGYYK